ncbi:MAG TPA: RNA 2'-phosphotransferase [Polyangiaceae bacterium]|nr:RNA 2'-phosphotransferase [Polyangiaceae bacterium]
MAADDLVKTSKFLSYVLRHRPEELGLTLDPQGWVDVALLLERCRERGRPITRAHLDEVVRENPKRRFALSDDGARIRASQGHSVEVELAYAPASPPATLFHGTPRTALAAIRAAGLSKMARHHVHLSADTATARAVGGRRGEPVVLTVDAARMHADGHVFTVSANGVWLTERVPPEYLGFPAGE